MKVEEKNVVIVDYTGKFDDGTVFDSSKNHGKPLEFQMGEKMVIPGFENALIGMEKGQEKEKSAKPGSAEGDTKGTKPTGDKGPALNKETKKK